MFDLEKITLKLQRLFAIEIACYEQDPINHQRLEGIYKKQVELKEQAIKIANAL